MNKGLALSLVLICLMLPIRIDLAQTTPMLIERGRNYEIWKNPDGTFTWRSAPLWIWNGSAYVPFIIKVTDENITVQAGLIGAEFHRGKVVYYDPSFTRLAVGRENWLVFRWDEANNKWIPVCASLAEYFKSVSIYEGNDYLNITASWETNAGNLTVIYHFEEYLKHTVLWKPNNAGKYAIVQFWNETVYDDVKLSNATVIKRTDDVIIGKADALTVLFHNSTQPFGILEDQSKAYGLLHKVLFAGGTLNYQGITITDAVAWIFYNSTLSVLDAGETLRIDPDTYTANPSSTHKAYYANEYDDTGDFTWNPESTPTNGVLAEFGTGALDTYNTYAQVQTSDDTRARIWRTGDGEFWLGAYHRFQFNYTASGVYGIINQINFTWEGYVSISGADNLGLYIWAKENGAWVTKETLTSGSSDSVHSVVYTDPDINSLLDGDWLKFGISGKVHDASAPAVNVYTDYVELTITYTPNYSPTIGEFQAPSTVYASRWFYLNVTVNDADGVSDFKCDC